MDLHGTNPWILWGPYMPTPQPVLNLGNIVRLACGDSRGSPTVDGEEHGDWMDFYIFLLGFKSEIYGNSWGWLDFTSDNLIEVNNLT
jgi:hypothetical protein